LGRAGREVVLGEPAEVVEVAEWVAVEDVIEGEGRPADLARIPADLGAGAAQRRAHLAHRGRVVIDVPDVGVLCDESQHPGPQAADHDWHALLDGLGLGWRVVQLVEAALESCPALAKPRIYDLQRLLELVDPLTRLV